MGQVLIKADSRFPVNRKRIRQLTEAVLKKHGLSEGGEVSIFIVGDRKMRKLNETYLKRKGTATVLAFPLENTAASGSGFAESPDGVLRLGDVVVSYPQAFKRASQENVFVDEVIDQLIEHGLANLLGVGR